MKGKWIYGAIVVAVLAVGIGVYLYALAPSGVAGSGQDTFSGRIVGGARPAETYTDLPVLTDEGCTTDPRTGLANCTTKLQTPDGVLAFNYEHDMMDKPCLSIGDKANIEVLSNGDATVTRTYWAGGGA